MPVKAIIRRRIAPDSEPEIKVKLAPVSTLTQPSTNIRWRVMLSSKLWDQTKYEHRWKDNTDDRRFAQSKGRCKMIDCPKKGDSVYFVLSRKIVMTGTVESDGFMNGIAHHTHVCNIGDDRPHTEPLHYAMVKIDEVGLSREIKITGQQTWIKYNDEMLIH